MNRKDLFNKMLAEAKIQNFGYIGTGNIESKILIIGKEVAIGEENNVILDQYEKNNILWEEDIDKTLWDIPSRNFEVHSPVCPYKGQYLKIDNGENWGTSRTWLNYQKLHNYIYGDSYDRVNFHKNFFITELNSKPSSKTSNALTGSVSSRKDFIQNSEYFQNFPIVILAGLGYFEISANHNDIEEIFGVKFTEQRFAGKNKSNPFWIHWNNEKTKIVINTAQLSMAITNDLLEQVANEITNSELNYQISQDISEAAEYRWQKGGKDIYKSLEENQDFQNSDEYKDYMTWV